MKNYCEVQLFLLTDFSFEGGGSYYTLNII